MPFAGYNNFAACIRANRNKRNPQAYCGAIMHEVEGKSHEYHVEIDKEMQNYGETHYDDETIKINPERGDVVNTIIHEKLHANYPDMPHDEVYANAAKIESKMTLPEMAIELLEIHERSKYPIPKREVTETIASKVIKNVAN